VIRWWRRKRDLHDHLDEYVARERAEAQAVHADTRRQAEETRTLKAESTQVHESAQRMREQNHFTSWLNQALRGVQEDGR
jgi:hypothetical protein